MYDRNHILLDWARKARARSWMFDRIYVSRLGGAGCSVIGTALCSRREFRCDAESSRFLGRRWLSCATDQVQFAGR